MLSIQIQARAARGHSTCIVCTRRFRLRRATATLVAAGEVLGTICKPCLPKPLRREFEAARKQFKAAPVQARQQPG
jgi:hypothetical protein